jgi:hypothetical protein
MFQDEARFGRINHPKRCWAPKGIRPHVAAQMIYEYTYVYAAVSPLDGVLDSLILPKVDAEAMSIFLKEVSTRHADEYAWTLKKADPFLLKRTDPCGAQYFSFFLSAFLL